jgi:nicotinamidase-related amidase
MKQNAALVLIEFQKEWLEPDGKINGFMKDRSQFSGAIEGGRAALAAARSAELPIAHCGLRFQPGYPEFGGGSGHGLKGAIPRVGTFPIDGVGSQFGDEFQPSPGEFIVYGRTGASGFAGSNLDVWLRGNRIETMYLAGFALHVCVESTLRAGHDLGYEMVVLSDATSAFTAEQRAHVLDHVVHHYGSHVTVEEFAATLSRSGDIAEMTEEEARSAAAA